MKPVSNEGFYFVRHPKYDSFALIQVSGELPTKIPDEIHHLMPGNKSGVHDGVVVVEQDQKYLEEQVMIGCPNWFGTLQDREWKQSGNLKYRLVGTYLFM